MLPKCIPGLDHKAIFVHFSFSVEVHKKIPKEKFISNWVIDNNLERDSIFIDVIFDYFNLIQQESEQYSPSYVWHKVKEMITVWAKKRSKIIKMEKNYELRRILDFYEFYLEDMSQGQDVFQELKDIIKELDNYYKKEIEINQIKAKNAEIVDNSYEILKEEKQRKFENKGKINELKIGNNIYKTPLDIINAVEIEMRKELTNHDNIQHNNL